MALRRLVSAPTNRHNLITIKHPHLQAPKSTLQSKATPRVSIFLLFKLFYKVICLYVDNYIRWHERVNMLTSRHLLPALIFCLLIIKMKGV